jgi:hypothetical protein|tara:strand:- start:138 stop:479 length:342 start_codon:yes stop_codon:yes gene_type:complete
MKVYDVLCDIANSLDIEGLRCPSVVDLVEEAAANRGLYGRRMCSRPIDGSRLRRMHNGQVQHTNWHESWLHESDEGNFVVDPCFPKKVYPLESYVQECFLDHENVGLSRVEEP